MKLTIHIGHPKCGSSTIQNFLYSNITALNSMQISVFDYKLDLYEKTNHPRPPVKAISDLRHGQTDIVSFHKKILKTFEQARKYNINHLILSAENLSDIRIPDMLSDLVKVFDVKIVYYIRRQDDWLLSSWKQWQIKQGIQLHQLVENYTKTKKSNYKQIISSWLKFIDKSRIHVNFINKGALYNEDLCQDFCHFINIDYSKLCPVHNSNPSFDFNLLNTLSKVPFVFNGTHDNQLYHILETEFGDEILTKNENPLTEKQRSDILIAHYEENQWLKENFFSEKPFEDWLYIEKSRPITPTDPLKGLTLLQGVILKLLLDYRKKQQK